jgi:predicted phage-related endonuclease
MTSIQGSDLWRLERVGKVTASRIADLLATTRNGWGASRAAYAATLIAERLTGVPAATYDNAEMRWGRETEALARAIYAVDHDVEVHEVGFISHPTIAHAGASPDGLIGEHGLLEIKCPTTHHHIELLQTGKIPQRYIQQMYFQGACTQRQWADFMSYDPRLPESLQCFVARIEFDPIVMKEIEDAVIVFLNEIDEKITQLQQSYRYRRAAA